VTLSGLPAVKIGSTNNITSDGALSLFLSAYADKHTE
jgi:hypothetical protein